MSPSVFLGGSCGTTDWRATKAIPLLNAGHVAFYNPLVADWKPELVAIEAKAKEEAACLLFIIDGETRGIASMLEALSQAGLGRRVFVCCDDIPDGTVIEGQTVTGRELKDLNRARAYFRDEIQNHKTATFRGNTESAVGAAIYYIQGLANG